MSIWGWSTLGALSNPIFLVTTLVFVAGILYIAQHCATVSAAAELGALYGYLYGVAVWGSVGYYFDFGGEVKLFFATMVLLDSVALAIVARLVLNWLESRESAH